MKTNVPLHLAMDLTRITKEIGSPSSTVVVEQIDGSQYTFDNASCALNPLLGKSIIGSLWSGEKDPTKIVEGGPRPSKGISGILRPEDSDCSGNNVFAFLWKPLCVEGKGIYKVYW